MSLAQKKWVRVTPCQNIPAREGRCVEVAGRQIAIFHSPEGFLAALAANRIEEVVGIVNGTTVVCPLHTWKYDLNSGASTNHPESGASLTTFPTRVEDGIVCIELPLETETPEAATIACEHRDRPLRWVQRKPLSPPPSAADNSADVRG